MADSRLGAHGHGEKEAVRLIRAGSKELGLPGGVTALAKLPKSDERKVLLALILRKNTSVSNDWIASNLAMGHPGSVSRMISVGRSDRRMSERLHALDKSTNNLAEIHSENSKNVNPRGLTPFISPSTGLSLRLFSALGEKVNSWRLFLFYQPFTHRGENQSML